jgi:tRNA(Ile)-lysidine synthase
MKEYHMNNKKEKVILSKDNVNKNTIEFNKFNIEFSVMCNCENDDINLNQGHLIQYFDFDKINDNISIRNRKDGDKIIPLGMNGNKKIKDLFIDMKIPKEERDKIPILCFDEKVAWIIGIRISEEYKITNKSKNILKVVVQRKEH